MLSFLFDFVKIEAAITSEGFDVYEKLFDEFVEGCWDLVRSREVLEGDFGERVCNRIIG